MKNWSALFPCSIPIREVAACLILFASAGIVRAQVVTDHGNRYYAGSSGVFQDIPNDTVPDPNKVMLRSVIIPGWGQLTNQQGWKVPIIYGALAGITWYAFNMHDYYTDFRAAYYNTHSDDFKFGQTPEYIEEANQTPQSLQFQRDFYRTRRDFSFLAILLAYGLNIVDAYVFAHFRDFDVSDDLSAGFNLKPDWKPDNTASVSLSFRLSF